MKFLPFLSSLMALAFLFAACVPTPTTPTPTVVRLQATSGARPWLDGLYRCAGSNVALRLDLRVASMLDPYAADLIVRLGEPPVLDRPAFLLGEETIRVVVHPQNPVTRLTADQLRDLFAGRIANWSALGGPDLAVQVWVFEPGEDIQQVFGQAALAGVPVTSLARMASSPEAMLQAVAQDPAAVGLLPQRSLTGSVRALDLSPDLTTALTVPVLVIALQPPDAALSSWLVCAQSIK